jgi:hypothetical protein
VQHSADEEADWVPFTIRLTKAMHDWLRTEAFFARITMSDIVREEVEARMVRSQRRHAATGFAAVGGAVSAADAPTGPPTGPIGIVKA